MTERQPTTVPSSDGHSSLDQFYIRTEASPADEHTLVLKQGETFVVLDRYGEIAPVGLAEEGLYHEGTRYLSQLTVRLGGQHGLLLSSGVKEDNALVSVDLTNLDLPDGDVVIPRGTLHISTVLVLHDGVLHQQVRLRNYGEVAITTFLATTFDADYADIFEVRGTKREARGMPLPPQFSATGVVLGYRGLDGVTRRTRVTLGPQMATFTARSAHAMIELQPGTEHRVNLTYACERQGADVHPVTFDTALTSAARNLADRRARACQVTTSNDRFNAWLGRSAADLAMMITDTPTGPFPYAGVPWFSAPFGRDSIITGLEFLWAAPEVSLGVLEYLAATQATTLDAARDAEPGKILHESRMGEMAALGEIPFGRYYGSHDATPLFVVLAAAYYDRTADRAAIERLWPHITAALHWLDDDADPDRDGFVEYMRRSPDGLVNQGWKDSHDAVFHRHGALADGPIALCELQAYAFAAWRGAARLAALLDQSDLAATWQAKADTLQARFDRAFWCEDLGTYALALDGDKRRCEVRTSNAGHVLFAGLATPARAIRVAQTLLTPEHFSGWGIRTVASTEARYNPMSYHNGSIWPHDNALAAAGLARYGLMREACAVADGLFAASAEMELHRLPELFCGFPRRAGESPVLYPVACNPQTWAAASVYLVLQAVLGMEVNAPQGILRFTRSRLPIGVDEMHIDDLRVGTAVVDLGLERHLDDVSIRVRRRSGDVEVVHVR